MTDSSQSKRDAEVADWLRRTGFPYDWQSSVPAPWWLVRALAESWAKAEGGPSADEWADTIQDEQVFA